ncbi:hypothetical protein C8Q74DRAFT_1374197 [Fomes fomentarius]|nr:hypothetical protein C8Q74DRAFT_1374197 [Fomes fomentarius]
MSVDSKTSNEESANSDKSGTTSSVNTKTSAQEMLDDEIVGEIVAGQEIAEDMDMSSSEHDGTSQTKSLHDTLLARVSESASNTQCKYWVTVEDDDSSDEEDTDEEDGDGDDSDCGEDSDEDMSDDWDPDDDVYNPELSARNRLFGAFMRDVVALDSRLSEEDKRLLQIYAYQLKHKLTENAYKDLPSTFDIEDLPSLKRLRSRVAFLAGLEHQLFDCCIQSCMAYTGPYTEFKECLYCEEPRYDTYSKPWQ